MGRGLQVIKNMGPHPPGSQHHILRPQKKQNAQHTKQSIRGRRSLKHLGLSLVLEKITLRFSNVPKTSYEQWHSQTYNLVSTNISDDDDDDATNDDSAHVQRVHTQPFRQLCTYYPLNPLQTPL